MTPETMNIIAEAVQAASGGLAYFQHNTKKQLEETKGAILQDDEFVRFVGLLACNNRHTHTDRWRKYLIRNWGFEFTPGNLGEKCDSCKGSGWVTYTYGSQIAPRKYKCRSCNGTGKARPNNFTVKYRGITL